MGNTTSRTSDLTDRLSFLQKSFRECTVEERSQPDFLRGLLDKLRKIGEELDAAIERGEVKSKDRPVEVLRSGMKELISAAFALLGKVNYAEAMERVAKELFAKVLAGVQEYRIVAKKAGRDVEINQQVLVGYLTGLANATEQWNTFVEQESSAIQDHKPRDGRRDAMREEWNQLLYLLGQENKAIQQEKEQAKKEKAEAFQGHLDKAEKELPKEWGGEDGVTRLRNAVTLFSNSVANAGWNITDHTVQGFYGAAGQSAPDELLLSEEQRFESGDGHYDIGKLQAIGHATAHAERIKKYIAEKVAPKAHRAGLDATNPAVISFIRSVATEWCSFAETSDTGGSDARVNNFSRGDLISTIKDLPDESRTAKLSLDERIELIRMQLSKTIDREKAENLKRTLANLLEKRENK